MRDVNGGALRSGDVLEYTVTATNTGNDASIHTVMTDVLLSQVTYVPESLALVTPTALALTDASGDDTGEYNAATRTVTVRLGTGANATTGGTMAIGDTITLKFQVTLNASASGTIDNQANITADGQLGAPTGTFPTDGNGTDTGVPPTSITVNECGVDTDCAAPKPYCDVSSSPRVCVACITSAQCSSATAPECNATTHVCECPAGTASCLDSDGDGLTDVTEIAIGTNPYDADSDDDGVPDGSELAPGTDSDGDGLINALDPDSDNDGLFDGTEMGLNCSNSATNVAAGHCIADADSGQTRTFPLVPDTDHGGMLDGKEDTNHDGRVNPGERNPNDPSDDSAQCYADSECGAIDSGQVCDTNHTCIAGCRGIGGNGCLSGQTCNSTNDLIGACSTATGTGGAPSTGGTASTGGVASTGGDTSTGGTIATGGAVATGGSNPTGGTVDAGGSATGGEAATGGAETVAGSTSTGTGVGSPDDGATIEGGGCSCRVVERNRATGTWLTLIAGALLFWRRQQVSRYRGCGRISVLPQPAGAPSSRSLSNRMRTLPSRRAVLNESNNGRDNQ